MTNNDILVNEIESEKWQCLTGLRHEVNLCNEHAEIILNLTPGTPSKQVCLEYFERKSPIKGSGYKILHALICKLLNDQTIDVDTVLWWDPMPSSEEDDIIDFSDEESQRYLRLLDYYKFMGATMDDDSYMEVKIGDFIRTYERNKYLRKIMA
jgi:hypothetical protein